MMTSRSDLRKTLRERRRALSASQHLSASQGLAAVLQQRDEVISSQRIALYLANDGEIDPAVIQQVFWEQGKDCYLPVLDSQNTGHLKFAHYLPDSPLVNNCYGIPEPKMACARMIEPQQLDLVLLPLTGFDDQGQRLGMGGGFYDRTFEFARVSGKPYLM
ncbi:MAG: 5-formyltetrahydrofolate cyclo-ligase, partial [Endozoicomonas sp.]